MSAVVRGRCIGEWGRSCGCRQRDGTALSGLSDPSGLRRTRHHMNEELPVRMPRSQGPETFIYHGHITNPLYTTIWSVGTPPQLRRSYLLRLTKLLSSSSLVKAGVARQCVGPRCLVRNCHRNHASRACPILNKVLRCATACWSHLVKNRASRVYDSE